VEAINIRVRIAHFLYLILGKGKARVKGKGSDPNNHIRTREGRRSTPTSRTRHLSKLKPDLPTNRLGRMGAESM